MINLRNIIRLLQLSTFFFIPFSVYADNYHEMKAFSDQNVLQMVVEIPGGTNRKIEYDKLKNEFIINKKNGIDRVIDFLSYPGNYGFIPSTLMDKGRGGDGDALDVLLISEQLDTGTFLDVIPIAVLVLEDSGEIDTKIIAIPANKNLQVIDANLFKELNDKYPALKKIIQLWFLNYKGKDSINFISWGDEVEALNEINKWIIR